MGEISAIGWTDGTFNPWWGCEMVSPACTFCYAETFAKRLGMKLWGPGSERRFFGDKHWNEPLRWNRKAEEAGVRRRIFCASMADVFEDRDDLIPHRARLFDLIEKTPWIDWQMLTKRPQHILTMIPERWRAGLPSNVWMGTTVEDQKRADERVTWLLQVPARVRFLSVEPMLGPVDLTNIGGACGGCHGKEHPGCVPRWDALGGSDECAAGYNQSDAPHRRIQWVIAGSESRGKREGRKADLDWYRSLRDQCAAADVPFFLKQAAVDGQIVSAPELDGERHQAFPEAA